MAVHFGNFLWGRPEMRPDALRHVGLRALKLTSFIAGGVVAALTADKLEYFVFLLAVPPITFAALRSLVEPAGQAVAEATPISQATPDV